MQADEFARWPDAYQYCIKGDETSESEHHSDPDGEYQRDFMQKAAAKAKALVAPKAAPPPPSRGEPDLLAAGQGMRIYGVEPEFRPIAKGFVDPEKLAASKNFAIVLILVTTAPVKSLPAVV